MSIVIPSVIEYLYSLKRKGKSATVEMKVYGNCGKCKTRIEKAAKVKGVKKASWDMDSKILTLTYSPKTVKLDTIHERLALAGHDTENLYAPKKKYEKLPDCCKYKRD
jgi:copper chaperone CopZ